jgi:hypothetical protein
MPAIDSNTTRIDTLYYAPALPGRLVARGSDGNRYVFPAAPAGPEAWAAREPYRGHHELLPMPAGMERRYDPDDPDELVTTGQAYKLIGCAPATIDKAIKRGDLRVVATRGNRRMLSKAAVLRWAGPPGSE